MDSLLRMKLANKYNLYHRQKINSKTLENIYISENIEEKDIYRIFDISSASKCKLKKHISCNCLITIYSQDEINTFKSSILNCNNKISIEIIKEKYRLTSRAINEIRKGKDSKSTLKLDLDLKYLCGKTFINKDDISKLKEIYNSTEDNLIKNISGSKRIFSVYKYALQNNKRGICILKDTRISNRYFMKNYEVLNKYLEIKSNAKCSAYKCFDIKDDLKSEAYEQICRDGGIYENNIKNQRLAITYLLNIADNKMNSFISRRPKYASLMYKIDGEQHEIEIPDYTYNPENILMDKFEGNKNE